ncbi:MAG: Helicase [Thermodesulfobacteriota bacterium]|nr:Helicase [Thermodesulfobacteriota bacterium]
MLWCNFSQVKQVSEEHRNDQPLQLPRRASLYEEFLKKRLTGARRYHRIAGYFQSSLLELAAGELAACPDAREILARVPSSCAKPPG